MITVGQVCGGHRHSPGGGKGAGKPWQRTQIGKQTPLLHVAIKAATKSIGEEKRAEHAEAISQHPCDRGRHGGGGFLAHSRAPKQRACCEDPAQVGGGALYRVEHLEAKILGADRVRVACGEEDCAELGSCEGRGKGEGGEGEGGCDRTGRRRVRAGRRSLSRWRRGRRAAVCGGVRRVPSDKRRRVRRPRSSSCSPRG